ncbi:MAG: sulfate adenylyltransferase [Sporolactobacillus sp.]|jgi:sulfate adenylyltransferase|nr:sulfate adenylyltransferase [Sporolactobacillus sp.]
MMIMTEYEGIRAHGGILVDRESSDPRQLEAASALPSLIISDWSISDLELIGIGGFSPLTGFMGQADYDGVVHHMHLASGVLWSIPITLSVSAAAAERLPIGADVALKGRDGTIYGTLRLAEKYSYDKTAEARLVYGTTDTAHPGVQKLYRRGDINLGGPISLLRRPAHEQFKAYYKDPRATRRMFAELGWKTIVGFQTRNPIHRAHEYLQKCALELVDGLLLNPLVGETKSDDVPADVRMQSYRVLIDHYYPRNRVRLVIYPAAMRYAGPREAILHAIVRKNYGCTHFIVGRDHAGVGDYYGTYAAQELISQVEDELGMTILKFDYAFYCRKCGNMATEKTCPHAKEDHIYLSGTKVRAMLRRGEKPPKEFTRPEVADVLVKGMRRHNDGE